MDAIAKRDELTADLEAALTLADEMGDSVTAYLIETGLDQARADNVGFGASLRPEAEAEKGARRLKTKAEISWRRPRGNLANTHRTRTEGEVVERQPGTSGVVV